MITANVFQRTFFIKSGNSTGTAFSIDVDNRRYLVTASHVCADGENTTEIQIYHEATWKNLPVKVVGMGDPTRLDADIAVLAADTVIGAAHPLPASSEGLIWGQDVYFLGYPYGLHTLANVNGGFPLPLVKRALMSGSVGTEFEVFLLDGHNNPGFSGGPVVFKPSGSQQFSVMGVVSAYRTEEMPVTLNGQPTGLAGAANTGIIIAPSIKRATDMIESNPIGPTIEVSG